MLGKNDDEALRNCDLFDNANSGLEQLIVLSKLISDCKDMKKKEYVDRILKKYTKIYED